MPPSQTRWISRYAGGRFSRSAERRTPGWRGSWMPLELLAHPGPGELERLGRGRLDERAEVGAQLVGVDA